MTFPKAAGVFNDQPFPRMALSFRKAAYLRFWEGGIIITASPSNVKLAGKILPFQGGHCIIWPIFAG